MGYLSRERREIQNENNQNRNVMVGDTKNYTNQSGRRPRERRLVINALHCQYDILETVANQTNFKLSYDDDGDWDIWWIDGMINPSFLHKMK